MDRALLLPCFERWNWCLESIALCHVVVVALPTSAALGPRLTLPAARECLDLAGGAGHHQDIAGQDARGGQRVLEILAGALDAHHRHAETLAHVGVGQRLVVGEFRRLELGDGEAVIEFDEVHHAPGDQVRHALAHVHLGVHHVMGADALGDLSMLGRQGLDPDILHAQFRQHHQRHQARGQVGADAHDRVREFAHTQLAHRALVGGVGLHRVGQPVGPSLHQVRVAVDAHDVVAEAHQRVRDRTAKASQADDDHAHQRRGQRDGAHPAQVHQQRHRELAGRRQVRRDAGAQPRAAECRDYLENDLIGRKIGDGQQRHGAADDHRAAQDDHRDGLALRAGADAPPERFRVRMAAHFRQHQQHQDGDRAHLDAARRAGAAAADEHQQVVQRQRLLRERGDIDRVEARRARRHRQKRGVEQFVGQRQRAQRARVAPLGQQDGHQTARQQQRGAGQRELGVQRPVTAVARRAGILAPAGADIVQHRKAHATHHDGQHQRQQDQGVAGVAHHAVGVDRKTGVGKRRDGMECAAPRGVAPGQVVTVAQAQSERGSDDQLRRERHHQHQPRDAGDVAQAQGAGFHACHEPGAQARGAVDQKAQQGGGRHHAEAAALEQEHDKGLAKARPVRAGIDRRQSRHAHGRHGREKRRQQRCAAAPCVPRAAPRARGRQHQHRRADDDRGQEAEGHGARGMEHCSHGRRLYPRVPAGHDPVPNSSPFTRNRSKTTACPPAYISGWYTNPFRHDRTRKCPPPATEIRRQPGAGSRLERGRRHRRTGHRPRAAAVVGPPAAVDLCGRRAGQPGLPAAPCPGPVPAQLSQVRRPARQGRHLRRLGIRHHRRRSARPLPVRAGADARANRSSRDEAAHRLHRGGTGTRADRARRRLYRRFHAQAPGRYGGRRQGDLPGDHARRYPLRRFRSERLLGAAGGRGPGRLRVQGVRCARRRPAAAGTGPRTWRHQRKFCGAVRAHRGGALARAGQPPVSQEGARAAGAGPRRTGQPAFEYPDSENPGTGAPARDPRQSVVRRDHALLLAARDAAPQLRHRRQRRPRIFLRARHHRCPHHRADLRGMLQLQHAEDDAPPVQLGARCGVLRLLRTHAPEPHPGAPESAHRHVYLYDAADGRRGARLFERGKRLLVLRAVGDGEPRQAWRFDLVGERRHAVRQPVHSVHGAVAAGVRQPGDDHAVPVRGRHRHPCETHGGQAALHAGAAPARVGRVAHAAGEWPAANGPAIQTRQGLPAGAPSMEGGRHGAPVAAARAAAGSGSRQRPRAGAAARPHGAGRRPRAGGQAVRRAGAGTGGRRHPVHLPGTGPKPRRVPHGGQRPSRRHVVCAVLFAVRTARSRVLQCLHGSRMGGVGGGVPHGGGEVEGAGRAFGGRDAPGRNAAGARPRPAVGHLISGVVPRPHGTRRAHGRVCQFPHEVGRGAAGAAGQLLGGRAQPRFSHPGGRRTDCAREARRQPSGAVLRRRLPGAASPYAGQGPYHGALRTGTGPYGRPGVRCTTIQTRLAVDALVVDGTQVFFDDCRVVRVQRAQRLDQHVRRGRRREYQHVAGLALGDRHAQRLVHVVDLHGRAVAAQLLADAFHDQRARFAIGAAARVGLVDDQLIEVDGAVAANFAQVGVAAVARRGDHAQHPSRRHRTGHAAQRAVSGRVVRVVHHQRGLADAVDVGAQRIGVAVRDERGQRGRNLREREAAGHQRGRGSQGVGDVEHGVAVDGDGHGGGRDQRIATGTVRHHQHAVLQPGRAPALVQVREQHRVFGIQREVQHFHAFLHLRRHAHAVRVFRVEHHRPRRGAGDHALDFGQVGQRFHAIHAQVVGADVQHHGHVAAVERQAALEDAAARRFQHREIDVRRRQHLARRPVAGAVALVHQHAVDGHAFGGSDARAFAGLACRVRQQQRRGGLAVGAGDGHHGNAAVVAAVHGFHDGVARVARLAAGRELVHADAGGGVHFDDAAILFVQRHADVAANDVDAGDIEADGARGADADLARGGVQQVGRIFRCAAGGEIGVAAQGDDRAGRRHAVEFIALFAHDVFRDLVEAHLGQHIGVAVAARGVEVFRLHQLADGVLAVARDFRRTAARGGSHHAAGDQHAEVRAFQVFFHDHAAAVAARVFKGRFHLLGRDAHGGHALALVGVQRFDGDRHADAARGALRLLDVGHQASARHGHARFGQQGLGQLLVAGDVGGHQRRVAGDGSLQALLPAAPAQLEQVRFLRQAQGRNAAAGGGVDHGAGAGADGAARGMVGQLGQRLVQIERLVVGQRGHQFHRQAERFLRHLLELIAAHHAVATRFAVDGRGTAEAHGGAGQRLQFQRDVFHHAGHVGAHAQALHKTARLAGRGVVLGEAGHQRQQRVVKVGQGAGAHPLQFRQDVPLGDDMHKVLQRFWRCINGVVRARWQQVQPDVDQFGAAMLRQVGDIRNGVARIDDGDGAVADHFQCVRRDDQRRVLVDAHAQQVRVGGDHGEQPRKAVTLREVLVDHHALHQPQAGAQVHGAFFGMQVGLAVCQHVRRHGRGASAGAGNGAAAVHQRAVHGVVGGGSAQDRHQAFLVAAGHEDAVGFFQHLDQFRVVGVGAGVEVHLRALGDSEVAKRDIVHFPYLLAVDAGGHQACRAVMARGRHQLHQHGHRGGLAAGGGQSLLEAAQFGAAVARIVIGLGGRVVANQAARLVGVRAGGGAVAQRFERALAGAEADHAAAGGCHGIRGGGARRDDPVAQHLLFVAAEHTEHFGALALDQFPEAAVLGRLAALDPAGVFQFQQHVRDLRGVGQPVVDAAARHAAVIGVHVLAHDGFGLHDAHQFLFQVEFLDHGRGARAKVVEAIAVEHAAVECIGIGRARHQLLHALQRLVGVAGAGVVHRDVQREVIRVDAQFIEFVGRDQQVQRQLLVTEVVAHDFRQVVFRIGRQRQLDRTLHEFVLAERRPLVAFQAGQQFFVQHHVVFLGDAVAQLFEVGLDQRTEVRVFPAVEQAKQPGAVHQLGGGHALDEVQRMRFAGEVAARRAVLARVQVGAVLLAHGNAALAHPVAKQGDIVRDVVGQRARSLQLALQVGVGGGAVTGKVALLKLEIKFFRRQRRRRHSGQDWRLSEGGIYSGLPLLFRRHRRHVLRVGHGLFRLHLAHFARRPGQVAGAGGVGQRGRAIDRLHLAHIHQRQQRSERVDDGRQRDGRAALERQRTHVRTHFRIGERALGVQRRAQRDDARALGLGLDVEVELFAGQVDVAGDVDDGFVGVHHEAADLRIAPFHHEVAGAAIELHLLVAEQFDVHQVGHVEASRFQNEFADRAVADRGAQFAVGGGQHGRYRIALAGQRHIGIDLAHAGLHRFQFREQLLDFQVARGGAHLRVDRVVAAIETDVGRHLAAGHAEVERGEGEDLVLHADMGFHVGERNIGRAHQFFAGELDVGIERTPFFGVELLDRQGLAIRLHFLLAPRSLVIVAVGADGRPQVLQAQLIRLHGAREQRTRFARAVFERASEVAATDGAGEVTVGPVPVLAGLLAHQAPLGGVRRRGRQQHAGDVVQVGHRGASERHLQVDAGQRAGIGQHAFERQLVLAGGGVGLDRELDVFLLQRQHVAGLAAADDFRIAVRAAQDEAQAVGLRFVAGNRFRLGVDIEVDAAVDVARRAFGELYAVDVDVPLGGTVVLEGPGVGAVGAALGSHCQVVHGQFADVRFLVQQRQDVHADHHVAHADQARSGLGPCRIGDVDVAGADQGARHVMAPSCFVGLHPAEADLQVAIDGELAADALRDLAVDVGAGAVPVERQDENDDRHQHQQEGAEDRKKNFEWAGFCHGPMVGLPGRH
uniref:Uncharacterized protein n=1 Tax=Tanacetum cinerariifolium TaxID=118510 RepID=A0A699GF70_TANCI|nr:hypothetical protein [Tanacetum cinerariifolium]